MLILKPLSIDWSVAGANIPAVTFIAHAGLTARELAHMLDSVGPSGAMGALGGPRGASGALGGHGGPRGREWFKKTMQRKQ